jgi:hypothetical protein
VSAARAPPAALAGGGVAVEGVLNAAPATPEAIVRRADHGLATAFVKAPAKMQTHAKHRSHCAGAQLASGDRLAARSECQAEPRVEQFGDGLRSDRDGRVARLLSARRKRFAGKRRVVELGARDRRFRIERVRIRGAVMDASLLATGGAAGEPDGVVTPWPE